MEVVIILSTQWNVAPFVTLQTDIDDFIMLCNYYMNMDVQGERAAAPKTGKGARIRVNDRTATGGWF